MAQIRLDKSKCVYLGVCESMSPKYFELNDEGELDLPVGEQVEHADLDEVRQAVLGCPTEALTLLEDGS
ncbi:ferredoxin [Streptomyces sp. NPDC097610]|uniref:ferredoxin n=1 Tax=Streptomyces sp. NPDC097610 TaxID=3157227 RepID=UPI0033205024